MMDLVEMEIRELLAEYGYDSEKTPIVFGSALHALQSTQDGIGKNSILTLMDTIDSYIPTPIRDVKSPFLLPIEKTVPIPGLFLT
jgi:elongation factor Tu